MSAEFTTELIAAAIAMPKLMNKLYDDLLAPSAKEIGSTLCDIAKTVCLLSYPFMKGAAFKDRQSERISKTVDAVPEGLRVMPNPQLFLEYLDKTKYIPDVSTLMDAYDQLLSAAVNKERRNLVHPAFLIILAQLLEDEITILNHLKKQSFTLIEKNLLSLETNRFYKKEILENDFPLEDLNIKDSFFMYTEHLHKLDLVNFFQTDSTPERDLNNKQTASIQTYTLAPSQFGELFSKVCCKE